MGEMVSEGGAHNLREWLSQIEVKVDKLYEGMTALVRMEEKQIQQQERVAKLEEAMDGMKDRIQKLENSLIKTGFVFHIVERFGWVALAALLTHYGMSGHLGIADAGHIFHVMIGHLENLG